MLQSTFYQMHFCKIIPPPPSRKCFIICFMGSLCIETHKERNHISVMYVVDASSNIIYFYDIVTPDVSPSLWQCHPHISPGTYHISMTVPPPYQPWYIPNVLESVHPHVWEIGDTLWMRLWPTHHERIRFMTSPFNQSGVGFVGPLYL